MCYGGRVFISAVDGGAYLLTPSHRVALVGTFFVVVRNGLNVVLEALTLQHFNTDVTSGNLYDNHPF